MVTRRTKGMCDSTDGFYDILNNSDSCLIWGLNPVVTDGTPTKAKALH